MREGIEKKVKKCGGMASVRKLAESSQEAVVVTPPTIIPPLASSVANEANTTSGDVAFEVFVEALAFVVLPSSIVPPTIVVNDATASIGDNAYMGAFDDVYLIVDDGGYPNAVESRVIVEALSCLYGNNTSYCTACCFCCCE